MRVIRPLAIADETIKPCARPGTLYSAAYLAAPVTLARPSMREVGLPKWVNAVIAPSAYAIRLFACDCGVPRAACVSARTMARRADSLLESLWAMARARRRTLCGVAE